MRRKKQEKPKERFCYFCTNNIRDIDYKDADTIKKFTSNYAKILPSKRMGSCAKHQRKLERAVKRARFMALLPYTNR
ncbi:MAG: 30S ribosomal protein S18 [Patescibacteria group bacterium]|nr:30S ribosomal protein S18 [Patescibacteria group bacterium]